MKIVRILGGLGNQMFQYALYRSLLSNGENSTLDISGFDRYNLHNGFELPHIFENLELHYASKGDVDRLSNNNSLVSKLSKKIFGLKKTHIQEKSLKFDPDIFDQKGHLFLDGYWQSEKYFDNIKNLIRKDFRFANFSDKRNIEIEKIINDCQSVSVHVRRGDYVDNSLYQNICNLKYYMNAIDIIEKNVFNPVYFIFSNDIDWCKRNLSINNVCYYINWNKESSSYRDMQLMSRCKNNIIANSSFSWWGAWLNTNHSKIVISPSRWLNNDSHNIDDIVPSSWQKVNS